jgi:hypothetical protein
LVIDSGDAAALRVAEDAVVVVAVACSAAVLPESPEISSP